MAETMQDFITREKERLATARAGLMETRNKLDLEIAELDRENLAIAAYERAKTGRALVTFQSNTGAGNNQRRARRGSRREELVDLIRTNGPISRGEILDKMGLKGNKSGEMSVSNALTALTKNSSVVRQSGKYKTAA